MVSPLTNPSYLLSPLITSGVGFGLIWLVWRVGPRKRFSIRLFIGLLLTVALWGLLLFGMRSSPDPQRALLWDRGMPVVGLITIVVFYHFTRTYTSNHGQRSILVASYVGLAVVIALSPTELVIERMRVEYYGYAPVIGPAAYAILMAYPLVGTAAVHNLAKRYRASRSYEERNRLLYLIAGVAFLIVGTFLDALSNLPPVALWSNLAFCLLCTVAILKYNLLDIPTVARRSLTYILASGVVAIPYVGTLYLLSRTLGTAVRPLWVHVIIVAFIAISLRPLYTWSQRLVDRLFYRDRYDYLKALERFGSETQSITNLEQLCSRIVKLVRGALQTSSACLLLPSEDKTAFVTKSSTGLRNPPSGIVVRDGGLLTRWMRRHGEIISSKDFSTIPELQNIARRERQNLEKLRAEMYVPVKSRSGELSGLLILGEKLSQQDYSVEDRRLLSTFSSQIAVSLENARLYTDAVRARENLEVWLNSMSDCVIIVDADQTVQFMNTPAKQRFDGNAGARCWSILGKTAPCPSCPINKPTNSESASQHVINIGDREYDVVAAQLVDPDGSRSVIEVFRDITERQRMETALRQSEEKLRLMFESATQGVIVSDLNGNIVEVNQSALCMHGYDRKDEVIGRSAFEFIAEKDRTKARRNLKRAIEQDCVNNIEYTLLRKDGTEFDAELSAAVMRDASGTPIGFVAITQDISERKRAEERERQLQEQLNVSSRLASIGELAAGVAHEINNPLTAILGFSHLLLRKSADEKVRQDLEAIYSAAARAAKVVENLLTFARHREPQKQYADVNDVVRKTLELRAYELKTSNIEVITELAADLPKTMVDFHQIQEVFLNIVLNAEQAVTEANRGGKLRIKTEETNGCIRISFADNGPGIPIELLKKVFDPFFSLRRERGGTGLGLSVSHGIVTGHGGRIYAKSRPGKGATFFVELPVTTENTNEAKFVR